MAIWRWLWAGSAVTAFAMGGMAAEGGKAAPGTYAVIDTTLGKIKVVLFPDKAPNTVANFVGLAEGTKEFTDPKTNAKAKRPYYNGVIFHRVIKNFMIQTGDPLGSGSGGPGYDFEDEISPDLEYEKGTLAMANRGPDTNGSQFFICVSGETGLQKNYTIFGKVVEGQSVADAISRLPTSGPPRDRPLSPPVINKITIERVK